MTWANGLIGGPRQVGWQLAGEQPTKVPAMAARYAYIVPNGKPEVPVDIELYLAQLSASPVQWSPAAGRAALAS